MITMEHSEQTGIRSKCRVPMLQAQLSLFLREVDSLNGGRLSCKRQVLISWYCGAA